MEDKRITNGQLTASTYYNGNLSPWHGRLNHRWSWSVRTRNNRQWLQVNFQQIYRISGICTQGRQDASQWVKSYTLTYGLNAMDFVPFKENGRVKVLTVKFNIQCCFNVRCHQSIQFERTKNHKRVIWVMFCQRGIRITLHSDTKEFSTCHEGIFILHMQSEPVPKINLGHSRFGRTIFCNLDILPI